MSEVGEKADKKRGLELKLLKIKIHSCGGLRKKIPYVYLFLAYFPYFIK
jgi:hypothetical protein